jgi:hypothetical protein
MADLYRGSSSWLSYYLVSGEINLLHVQRYAKLALKLLFIYFTELWKSRLGHIMHNTILLNCKFLNNYNSKLRSKLIE